MKRYHLPLILTLAAVLAMGCSNDSADGPMQEPARLVVVIIYDQLPNWAYEKYGELLSPDGALNRVRARGSAHVIEYSYATTHTAPGHATIFTGVPPSEHGVYSNESWTPDRGVRSIVDDGEHGVHGLPDAFASPAIIRVDAVGDALRSSYGDKTKIVGISLKDRGAVLTTGRDPDLALWYEKRLGSITSSSYYDEALPEWVSAWIEDNPISDYFQDWVPEDPRLLESMLGPDDAPGEADYQGLGTTFPHNPAATLDPNRTFRATPGSSDYLLDLARATVPELGLGEDEIPDLLVLSISSTDYSGHVFGPDSWEYVDNLVRVDRAVGEFLAELERKSSVAVLITSDHGGAPLPERAEAEFAEAGRIYPKELPAQMNAAVALVLGDGDWVGPFVPPLLHLTAAASAPDKRERAMGALTEALEALPEVYAAYDARTAAALRKDSDPVKQLVGRSISEPGFDAVFLVHDRGSVADEGFEVGKGTGHGSPWSHDRLVPVVFAGPGVTRASSLSPFDESRVAATFCRLLGIEPPSHLRSVKPLPGLEQILE